MADKLILKPMHCPTCGGNLKAENDTDSITCVYCGNTIIPVSDRIQHDAPTPSGTV